MDADSRFGREFRDLLLDLGEDPDRAGLEKTPERVHETLRYLTRGYREDLDAELADGLFPDESRDLVVVRNIEFVSLCEHHLLPFIGHAHVGYVPDGVVMGLSKIARVVDHFACRMQVQERLTRQIADFLIDRLHPRGLGVVMTATHLCMVARGVRKQDSDVITSAWRGTLDADAKAREEFLQGTTRLRNG
jgi:GTP cyclohydrolase I